MPSSSAADFSLMLNKWVWLKRQPLLLIPLYTLLSRDACQSTDNALLHIFMNQTPSSHQAAGSPRQQPSLLGVYIPQHLHNRKQQT